MVAVVIASVIAVMAFADDDAFVATDFICVAAAFASDAALVTRVAAADDERLVAALVRDAGFFAVLFAPDALDVEALDVEALDVEALDVEAFDADAFDADVLDEDVFAPPVFEAVALVDLVDFVFAGIRSPPCDRGVYSTVRDPLHTPRHSGFTPQPGARPSWSPGTR
ncbi:hypothetical protein [Actinomadura sp. WAC 06369]|uniref:hypothetical protein n=1 Tax=Actinomadura sp. WAC 06369 TaxID=2203193 RepID=UPI000F7B4D65|nr:hypothetical protein [Actinomadura sp. WAC 06369]RSN71594.1 hypothetical protein DMH08_02230 [Actinomadura sp. WAC 06369]